jgi:hypothetical protein
MKKIIVLLLPLFILAGCNDDAVPISAKFPEVPKELMESCPDLALVDPDTDKLSDVMSVVAKNYGAYYECKIKVDNWIEWYKTQKPIFDKVRQ